MPAPANPSLPRRRSLRLPHYDYSRSGAYFVTICSENRESLFGFVSQGEMRLSDAGRFVQSVWERLPERFPVVRCDAFVVMPNHVHGILFLESHAGGASPAPTLGDVVGAFKSMSAVQVNRLLKRTGPLWQRNYFEHVIRNDESLGQIHRYIQNNPWNWDLDPENPHRTGEAAPNPWL